MVQMDRNTKNAMVQMDRSTKNKLTTALTSVSERSLGALGELVYLDLSVVEREVLALFHIVEYYRRTIHNVLLLTLASIAVYTASLSDSECGTTVDVLTAATHTLAFTSLTLGEVTYEDPEVTAYLIEDTRTRTWQEHVSGESDFDKVALAVLVITGSLLMFSYVMALVMAFYRSSKESTKSLKTNMGHLFIKHCIMFVIDFILVLGYVLLGIKLTDPEHGVLKGTKFKFIFAIFVLAFSLNLLFELMHGVLHHTGAIKYHKTVDAAPASNNKVVAGGRTVFGGAKQNV